MAFLPQSHFLLKLVVEPRSSTLEITRSKVSFLAGRFWKVTDAKGGGWGGYLLAIFVSGLLCKLLLLLANNLLALLPSLLLLYCLQHFVNILLL
jgi:hypothetical protein